MLIEEIRKYKVILASRSIRRQQLLKELGIEFEIILKEFDESFPDGLTGREIAGFVAGNKAKAFSRDIKDNEIIITADTIVWCGGKVLGKPVNAEDAMLMLREISGMTHEVITGVCLLTSEKSVIFTESTKVTFEEMSGNEIHYYVEKYAPFDKAGAYGIQEWVGLAACSHIEGSYFNVVGLPVHRLYKELGKLIEGGRRQATGDRFSDPLP